MCAFIVTKIDDKNPRSNLGYTPMHSAARRGHLAICELIQSKVADKNPAANDGTTPQMLAARFMNTL